MAFFSLREDDEERQSVMDGKMNDIRVCLLLLWVHLVGLISGLERHSGDLSIQNGGMGYLIGMHSMKRIAEGFHKDCL